MAAGLGWAPLGYLAAPCRSPNPMPTATARPAECLVQIVERVLPFRTEAVPTVDLITRLAAQSFRLLRLETEQATSAQNAAVLGLMRKRRLIAE
jgi:hypothetical protein